MISGLPKKQSRSRFLINEAESRTQEMLNSVPPSRARFRLQVQRIGEVCKLLVSSKPAMPPTASRVAEEGALRFEGFPSEQTLYNSYRELLQIWKAAFDRMMNASKDLAPDAILESELESIDAGTRVQIRHLEEAFKRLTSENRRLRQIVKENVEVRLDTPDRDVPLVEFSEDLRRWLTRLEKNDSVFEIDKAGVKSGRHCRPGTLILPRDLLFALTSLVKS